MFEPNVKVTIKIEPTGIFFVRDYLSVYCDDAKIMSEIKKTLDAVFKDLSYEKRCDWEKVFYDDQPKKVNPNLLRVKLQKKHAIDIESIKRCFTGDPKMTFDQVFRNHVIFTYKKW